MGRRGGGDGAVMDTIKKGGTTGIDAWGGNGGLRMQRRNKVDRNGWIYRSHIPTSPRSVPRP